MDRVLALADRLRKAGIDAILDQYETAPPEGWPKWMDRQIEEADFVLIVCTETYFNRVGGKAKPGIGRGVKWESLLAYQDIYDSDSLNAKYIPVLLDGVDESHIPRPLRATDRYLLVDAQEYEKLYRRITGQPLVVKPELGTIRSLPARPRQQSFTPLNLWNVPHERNPAFTGRHEILEALRTGLQKSKRQALSGLGGIGKTQIAVEYAYRHRNEYTAVFWIFADSEQSVSTGFTSIAKQLDLPEKDNAEQASITAAVRRWLDEQDGWLLIFDNAEQPELLRAFLPQQGLGHILLTSRAHVFQSLGIVKPLEIHELQPAEAREFLLKRTGREGANQEIADINTLAKELGYLPLALEQAGAFILEREASFANYLASFRKRRSDLLKERNPVLGTSHAPLATTWQLNFEQVASFPASADLLRLSAFLAPDAIPLELLEKCAAEVSRPLASKLREAKDDPLVLDEVLKPLIDYSLIRRNLETRSYSIHPLVQEMMRDGMSAEGKRSLAENVVGIVDAAFPYIEFSNWSDCERLIGHALACATHIELNTFESDVSARLLNQAACYLWERAQYGEAESLFRRALETREKVNGSEHPETARSLNNLAELYRRQAKYAEAEPLFRRALEIGEKVLGQHPNMAFSLNNLGGLYREQGKYAEAEPLLRRALEIRESVLGPQHPDTAISLNNLGDLYREQGKYGEAEPLLRRALEISEKANGPEHPDTAVSLNNLAVVYREQGKYDEAECMHRQALEIREKALGPQHPDTAQSVSNLALVYFSQRRHKDLVLLFRRALEIKEKALGPGHPETALSLSNLAFVYSHQGSFAEAEPLYRRALDIREKTLGSEHPYTLQICDNLINLYQKQDKLAEAEILERRFKSKSKDRPN
jgi:tetratricopeptide (TPR) repeat protein